MVDGSFLKQRDLEKSMNTLNVKEEQGCEESNKEDIQSSFPVFFTLVASTFLKFLS